MKQTYTSKLEKRKSKPAQTAKKGSKEWFINKYGKNKGEEQYYLSMALKANEKVRAGEIKNKSTLKATKQTSTKRTSTKLTTTKSTTKKPCTTKQMAIKRNCKRK